MDDGLRNLRSRYLQADELGCFTKKENQKCGLEEKNNGHRVGDTWVFLVTDAETKLVPSFVNCRTFLRRLTRLTNAFSKKLENLRAAVALHFACYNFTRIHSSLRCTPAMAAQVPDHLWEMPELLDAIAPNAEGGLHELPSWSKESLQAGSAV